MNIIEPKYEIIEQSYADDLIKDMMKHIEICGRNCYKSEDKITDDSYIKFISHLETANHGAMLEHGTVYLTIGLGTPIDDPQYMWKHDIINFFCLNKYSKINDEVINKSVDVDIKGVGMRTQASAHFYYITTNWRVIYENQDKLFIKIPLQYSFVKENLKESVLEFITKPTDKHEKRYTVKFTCDIGVSREFNRHRVDSIAEESTRYCNYSKDKFDNEINICKPVWVDQKDINAFRNLGLDIFKYCYYIEQHKDQDTFTDIDYWLFANLAAEYSYMNLIRLGWSPQQARTVLALDTKTTLVHTAFASDWKHFFDLRALGTTGAPHPSAKELAEPLMKEFIERKYIN